MPPSSVMFGDSSSSWIPSGSHARRAGRGSWPAGTPVPLPPLADRSSLPPWPLTVMSRCSRRPPIVGGSSGVAVGTHCAAASRMSASMSAGNAFRLIRLPVHDFARASASRGRSRREDGSGHRYRRRCRAGPSSPMRTAPVAWMSLITSVSLSSKHVDTSASGRRPGRRSSPRLTYHSISLIPTGIDGSAVRAGLEAPADTLVDDRASRCRRRCRRRRSVDRRRSCRRS